MNLSISRAEIVPTVVDSVTTRLERALTFEDE